MSKQNTLVCALSTCCLVLSIVVILFCFGVFEEIGSQNNHETAAPKNVVPDFQTPEATIEYLVKAINASDSNQMLQAFAIEEGATRRDFVAVGEMVGAFDAAFFLPPNYEEYKQFNKHYLAYQALKSIAELRFRLVLSDEYRAHLYGYERSKNVEIEELVKRMDPKNTPVLNIVKISRSEYLNDELVQRNAKKRAVADGAKDVTERAVLFEIEGRLYAGGFELHCYDNSWLISGLYAGYAGFSPPLQPLDSEAEFDQQLKRK